MSEYTVSEYDILTNVPNNLNVHQLMKVVRELRERLYQKTLLAQDLGDKLRGVYDEMVDQGWDPESDGLREVEFVLKQAGAIK